MSTAAPPLADAQEASLAAIDIGSNSFRLEIGQLARGRYKRVDYLKETVRLGGGLDPDGRLSEEAQLRGLACLARFATRLRGFASQQVRAVATQTLREAKNRDAFLARARTALGHPIEVISGREEARLIFAGVARLQPSERPRLVIDIGGRSTEMILGQGRTPRVAESFQVGSVSLSMRYFPEGRFSAQAFRAAQIAAGAELEEALAPFAPGQWVEALGASGTVGTVSQVLVANGVTDGVITPAGLRWCIEACVAAGREEALALAGLKPERRAVLGGGLSILYTLAMQFGIDALQPARGALRQGVLFDLCERLEALQAPSTPPTPATATANRRLDMRDASVQELQRRFGSDLAQAARVQRLALALYRSTATSRQGAGASTGARSTSLSLSLSMGTSTSTSTGTGMSTGTSTGAGISAGPGPNAIAGQNPNTGNSTNTTQSASTGAGDAETARELGWAAALHEIGMSVSHHDHHRHSAYLLSHVDAPGFSQSQQRRVADLVLGHRGSLRKLDAALGDEALLWPVLCLRLAALLCHARNDVPPRVARLRRLSGGASGGASGGTSSGAGSGASGSASGGAGGGALLRLQPAWAAGHPRTMHLLGEEVRNWERSGRLVLEVSAGQ